MNRLTDNKIVLVTRPTRLAELVVRFNTVSQARFYVEHQGADFKDYLREDETYHHALVETQAVLGQLGRVQVIDRSFLPNFVFGPEDTVVTLGQDGLAANTLKYLLGQPVVGVNPDPARWDGKLLPFKVGDLKKIVPEVFAHRRPTKSVTMAQASLNNGQTMFAVNDLFIGPKSHGSARYLIRCGDAGETQSSSGVIVSTGLGSTGWLKSLLTGAAAITQAVGSVLAQHVLAESVREDKSQRKPGPKVRLNVRTEFAWDANYLFFTVREPFPTNTTGASLVFGCVTPETPLQLESQMAENGVIFSDGIEKDFLDFNSGTQAVINLAERKGVLVV
jgi:NAD kinase